MQYVCLRASQFESQSKTREEQSEQSGMFESMAIWKLEQEGTPSWKKSWIDYSLWMNKNYLSYIMKVLDRLFTTDE
jgi:hypothetical protein